MLGGIIWHDNVGIRLTEVEAYLGSDDPASHAFGGDRGRASTMFLSPGRLYVYRSYGIHLAANLVCSPAGQASAVLLRAGEVIAGHQIAAGRRGFCWDGRADGVVWYRLARGPGNLGRALGLSPDDDGVLLGGCFRFDWPSHRGRVECGPRVGVSRAAERPLRFWIPGEPSVSVYRRNPRA